MLRSQTAIAPLLALTTLALSFASGCALRGSGVESSEVRELASFSEVEVGGAMDIHIEVDATKAQRVEISGDDNVVPKVTTEVRNGELVVGLDASLVNPELPLALTITVPSLDQVELSGASDLDVQGLHGAQFELEVSGAADAALAGSVDALDIEISGAAELDAGALEAKAVELELSGAGSAKVHATDTLDVEVSGAGSVEYLGSPTVTQEVSGAGSVRPAD